jgi:protease II
MQQVEIIKNMKEITTIKYWRRRDGKPAFPISSEKKIQKCFHEKQTEPQKGDPLIFCENCRQYKVDVDAMREEIKIVPKWLRKLCKLRILFG